MTRIPNRRELGLLWTTIIVLCFACCYLIGCDQPPATSIEPAPLPSNDEINRIRVSGMLPYENTIVHGDIVSRLDEVLEAFKPNSQAPNSTKVAIGGGMTFYYKKGGAAHIQFFGTGPRNDFLGFEMNDKYYHGGSKAKLREVLTSEMKPTKRDPKLPPLSPLGEE